MRPERRRVGSDEARVWARKLPLHNPLAKSVMLALANYVHDEPRCWPSLSTISEDTDQSEQTVRRRLVWLEELGVIVRRARWFDDDGRINYDGRGRRTSDEITFLMDVDGEALAARTAPNSEAAEGESVAPVSEISPTCQIGLNPDLGVPQLGTGGVSLESPLEDLPERLSNPKALSLPVDSSQESGSAREEGDAKSDPHLAKFLIDLQSTYNDPSNRPRDVAATCAAMTEEQRAKLLRAAAGAREYRRRNPRKAVLDLSKFVRDPAIWPGYEHFAPAPRPEFVTLEPGTLAWRVCALMREIAGFASDATAPLQVLSPIPDPAQMAQALDLDRSRWGVIEERSTQFKAWRELIKRWTGRWPEAQRIYLDPDGNPVPRERAAMVPFNVPGRPPQMVPKWRGGLAVPCPWPPRKDGTLAREGPPGPGGSGSSLMTEADYAEL